MPVVVATRQNNTNNSVSLCTDPVRRSILSVSIQEVINHIFNACKLLVTVNTVFLSFPASAIRLWNYLLTDIASIDDFNEFNMKLQQHLLTQYR